MSICIIFIYSEFGNRKSKGLPQMIVSIRNTLQNLFHKEADWILFGEKEGWMI